MKQGGLMTKGWATHSTFKDCKATMTGNRGPFAATWEWFPRRLAMSLMSGSVWRRLWCLKHNGSWHDMRALIELTWWKCDYTRVNVDATGECCRIKGQGDLTVNVCSPETLEQALVGLLVWDSREWRFGGAHFSGGWCGFTLLGRILTGTWRKNTQKDSSKLYKNALYHMVKNN